MSGNHPFNRAPPPEGIGQRKNKALEAQDLIPYKVSVKQFASDVMAEKSGAAVGHITFVFFADNSYNQHIGGNLDPLMLAAATAFLAKNVQANVQMLQQALDMTQQQTAALARKQGFKLNG